MENGPINVLAITSIALIIAEGQDSLTLDLLGTYFYLIGSTLKAIAVSKEYNIK